MYGDYNNEQEQNKYTYNRFTQEPYGQLGNQYYTQPQHTASNPAPSEPGKPRKRTAPRYIAAALALCLISGGAGGGITYYLVNEREAAIPSISLQEASSANTETTPLFYTQTGDISSIVKKASASVVEISTGTITENRWIGQYITEGAGSGVIVSDDGYIVTNNHVVKDTSSITVRTSDGTEYEAELVGIDSKTDLAVIKIDAADLTSAIFADSSSIEVGQLAVAIGNPLGTLGGTVTNGIISAKDREIKIGDQVMTLLQTSAAVNPGNSGGGLFDSFGNLVGVVNAKSAGEDIEGLGFAIPSNTVKEVVYELIEKGYVSGRPQLGISVLEIADPMTAAMYRLNGLGVYVASVLVDDSGLKQGDRISSIDGKEILSASDITKALSEHKVGDVLSVKVFRDGTETEIPVTLTEQIPESAKKLALEKTKA